MWVYCAGEFFGYFFFVSTIRASPAGLTVCSSGSPVSVHGNRARRVLPASTKARRAVCVCDGEADVFARPRSRRVEPHGDGRERREAAGARTWPTLPTCPDGEGGDRMDRRE